MGQKLALGFGLLLLMMAVFGGMVMAVMREVGSDAATVAHVHVPTVALSSRVANDAMSMIAEMRGYTSNFETPFLQRAEQHLQQARQALTDGKKELAQGDVQQGSAASLDNVASLIERYAGTMTETSAIVSRLREHQGEASAATDRVRQILAEVVDEEAIALRSARNAPGGVSTETLYREEDRITSYSQVAYQFEKTRAMVNRAQILRSPTVIGEQAARLHELEELLASLPSPPAGLLESARAHTANIRDLAADLTALENANNVRLEVGTKIMEAVTRMTESGVESTRKATEEGSERLAQASGRLLVGLLLTVLLGLIFAFLLARSITEPLARTVDFARGVTDGDFTRTLSIRQKDEVGDLARALNATVAGLREQTAAISEGVNVLASTVGEIATSTSELAANSTEVAASISETTATVEEVRQTSFISNEKAQQVSDLSQRVAQAAQSGGQAADAMVREMGRIREQMEAITSSIATLSEQSRTIGDIISTVDDLAEQSNILAVNAAIEAARAGEAGRGFSVVAQEIRALAEQSKRATGQVRGILNDIQRSTGVAVSTVEQGTRVVEAGQQQSVVAGDAIRTLIQGINEASEASTQIAAMSRQQVAGVDQVAVAMENIKQASSQTADSMRQLEEAAQNLSSLGRRLKELVARFRS